MQTDHTLKQVTDYLETVIQLCYRNLYDKTYKFIKVS